MSRLGGIASTRELLDAGLREADLTRAVRATHIRRISKGWYSTLAARHPRVIAIQAGGRLTGASALWHMGAWMLRRPRRVHVAIPAHASKPPIGPTIALHWESDMQPASSAGVVSLAEALVRVTLDADIEVSAACFDWAFATGRIDRFAFETIRLLLPADAQSIRHWVDPNSQSVLESVARVRIRKRGWRCRSQVRVGDTGAIDLVIEEHVAVELDGRRFHESTFESDRRKDLAITREGRHPLRVSTEMLTTAWPDVEAAIAAALTARGIGIAGDAPPQPRGHRYATGARAGIT